MYSMLENSPHPAFTNSQNKVQTNWDICDYRLINTFQTYDKVNTSYILWHFKILMYRKIRQKFALKRKKNQKDSQLWVASTVFITSKQSLKNGAHFFCRVDGVEFYTFLLYSILWFFNESL